MHIGEILFHLTIYLVAAVIAVPLSVRFGLGSVLGYIAAGLMIGPALGLVGTETVTVQHYAEFGVVLMLFLIGLEMQPKMLWEMRTRLLGLGGLQVGLTIVAIAGCAIALGEFRCPQTQLAQLSRTGHGACKIRLLNRSQTSAHIE